MKLKKLVLENFQGIRNLEFEPNGNDASVYGTNGSGKTTVYNGLTWLLFDKPSTGEKGFSPKTKDQSGEDVHFQNNTVEGTFILEDGTITMFRKELKENWVKKRGTNTETFSGNTTDYFIDGVPSSKNEYDSRLAEICPTEMAQILTQPEFFPEAMTWQQRRKLLLEVFGDVSEFEVINSSTELHGITQYLLKQGTSGQFYTVEEFQKIASAKQKVINDQIKQIPSRIDEAARAIPDLTNYDEAAISQTIEATQQEISELNKEIATMDSNSAEQHLRRQLAELNTAIAEDRARFNETKNSKLAADREHIAQLKSKRQALTYEMQDLKQRIARTASRLESTKNNRELLSNHYRQQKEITWNGDTICHACGQALPSNNIEEAKAKFNLHKSDELERIRATIEAECSKAIIADLEAVIEENKQALAKLTETIGLHDAEIEAMTIDIRPKELEIYENTIEYAAQQAQTAQIQEQLRNGNVDTNESKRALQAKTNDLQKVIATERNKLLLIQNSAIQQKRVEELKAEEKTLNKEYEYLSQGLYLCEEFNKTKAALLGKNINEKFTSVQFRLFETQINGSIKEDCEVMIPTENGLVPFSTANHASRINAGLEIIDVLSRHWGVTMPVFIDNSESVVKLKKIGSQVIRLVVSEADETLRIELNDDGHNTRERKTSTLADILVEAGVLKLEVD